MQHFTRSGLSGWWAECCCWSTIQGWSRRVNGGWILLFFPPRYGNFGILTPPLKTCAINTKLT
jgi:hypothetical protein